jgi:DNA-binding SARP family transcriptional activator
MLKTVFQEPHFRVCCLGRFKLVEAGSGTDMTPASRKVRALIAYLCIVRRPVGRERLASLLWGDRGDEQARASLRQTIYELRSMLAGDRLLKMERDTVAIGEEVSTDVAAILAAAQSGDLELLGGALAEWRGDFLEDLSSIDETFDTWLQSERLRVQERLINASVEAANAGMARGETDPARKIVGRLQQLDGTNEIVLRLGLRLDHLAADTAALHRRYERFRELLKSELDVAPSAETQRVFQDLATRPPAQVDGIASDSGSQVADREKECIQEGDDHDATRFDRPSLTQRAGEPGVATHTPRLSSVFGRRKLAAIALVVGFLGALGWAVLGLSHKPRPTSAGVAPGFTDASSGLSAEHLLLAIDTHSGQREDRVAAIEKAAQTAAQRTLARDPNNGEALGVLAVLTPSARLLEIDRLFERALRSEPNNAQLLNWHGNFLMMVGRSHEALEELTRAYERDRAAPSIASNLILAFLLTGRFEEAREIIDQGRDNRLHDSFSSLHVKYFLYRQDWFGLANYLGALPDDFSRSRAAFFRLCRDTAMAFVMREHDKFGQLRASWRAQTSADPDDAVQFLFALGDADGALAVIQSAARSRRNENLLTDPGWEALFDPGLVALRRDPRVAALFAQWGVSDYWRSVNRWPDFMR